MTGRRPKILLGAALFASAVGYLIFTGISSTGVYYHTVAEVLDRASIFDGRNLRVSGEVVGGSVDYDQMNLLLSFSVRDTENGQVSMRARYKGVMPDAFQADGEVILEGTYSQYDNLFNATVLLAKCPSKYESKEQQTREASSQVTPW